MFKKKGITVFVVILTLLVCVNAYSLDLLDDKLEKKLSESSNNENIVNNLISEIAEKGYTIKIGEPDLDVLAGEKIILKLPVTSGLTDDAINKIESAVKELGGVISEGKFRDLSTNMGGKGYRLSKDYRLNELFKRKLLYAKMFITAIGENNNIIYGGVTKNMNRIVVMNGPVNNNGKIENYDFIAYPGNLDYQVKIDGLTKSDIKAIKTFNIIIYVSSQNEPDSETILLDGKRYRRALVSNLTQNNKMSIKSDISSEPTENIKNKIMGIFGK